MTYEEENTCVSYTLRYIALSVAPLSARPKELSGDHQVSLSLSLSLSDTLGEPHSQRHEI